MTTKHTPGPWTVGGCDEQHPSLVLVSAMKGQVDIFAAHHTNETMANARLIAAAPELLAEAKILRMLVTSPRFACLTVADAVADLRANGITHDDGAALAKAEGK